MSSYYRPKQVEETYKFAQCFGDKNDHVEVNDGKISLEISVFFLNPFFCVLLADIISAIQFDKTGDFLASGDRAGRVVLFERNHAVRKMSFSIVIDPFLESGM